VRPEQALQRAVVQYLQLAAPAELFWTAINPIPGKSPAIAAISKAMGLRAGVADLLFIHEGHPLFIELKAKDGRESPAQRETSALAGRAATMTWICKSVEEVEAKLRWWGVPLKAQCA
jgi:hypothetical protein